MSEQLMMCLLFDAQRDHRFLSGVCMLLLKLLVKRILGYVFI